jgi:DNA-binding transcriptional ArsR family regulator
MEKVFEALASLPRRKILAYLSASDLTAGEIASRFEMTKPRREARPVHPLRPGAREPGQHPERLCPGGLPCVQAAEARERTNGSAPRRLIHAKEAKP